MSIPNFAELETFVPLMTICPCGRARFDVPVPLDWIVCPIESGTLTEAWPIKMTVSLVAPIRSLLSKLAETFKRDWMAFELIMSRTQTAMTLPLSERRVPLTGSKMDVLYGTAMWPGSTNLVSLRLSISKVNTVEPSLTVKVLPATIDAAELNWIASPGACSTSGSKAQPIRE